MVLMLIRGETLSLHISLPRLLSVATDTDSPRLARLSTHIRVLIAELYVCVCVYVAVCGQ